MPTAGPVLTWDQVFAWRMERQCLDRPHSVSTTDVVRRLVGVQAQVSSSAEQAVAVRRADLTSDVSSALSDRSLVKTWAMRGTLHLLPADAAASFLGLLASLRTWDRPAWQKEFATAAQMTAIEAAAAAALDGAVLTREELTAEIVSWTGDASLEEKLTSGWGAVLKPLAWQGLLCYAVGEGARVAFTSPASWLPSWSGIPDPDTAAATAIPAYLGAYGPASPGAFDQWLARGAIKKTLLKNWFAQLVADGALAEVEVDGETLYARAQDLDSLSDARPTDRVRLLPAFDQYVLGPGTRDTRILASARRPLVSKAAGWIAPVVVANGPIAGTWEAGDLQLRVELFGECPVDPAALNSEAAHTARVLNRHLTLSITTV